MKKIILLIIPALIFGLTVTAQSAPKTAEEILNNATAQAKKENKKVLIMFHASWCVWCKKMDASINDPSCKNYFNKNFVIAHITVFEQGDKVPLNNPGGQEMYQKYGGDNGIPFWLIFDGDGNMLANSNYKPANDASGKEQNIGCPSTEDEVNYFTSLLKKYTDLNDADTKAIHDRFRKNEVKATNASFE